MADVPWPVEDDDGGDFVVHPEAHLLVVPKWDEPGQCICGAVLPPMKEWDRAGSDWQNVRCSACPRGYVDEETFIAIYDDTSDWDEA